MSRLKVITFDPLEAEVFPAIHPALPDQTREAERVLNAAERDHGGVVVQIFTSSTGAVMGALLRVPAVGVEEPYAGR